MTWLKKNKWKVILPLLAAAVLTAAFYFGGNGAGTTGWTVDDAPGRQQESQTQQTEDGETEQTSGEEQTEDGETEQASGEEQTEKTETENSGQDRYFTDPVPEGKPLPVEPEEAEKGESSYTCTFSVSCRTLLTQSQLLDENKRELVPADGWILEPTQVTFQEGESVFDVLQRTLKEQKIHLEYVTTPLYHSAYIEGIANLYEFDAGELSGWMYKVNDWFPNYGCSRYLLQDGDTVCWEFTCDLGNDVGGGYAAGSQQE